MKMRIIQVGKTKNRNFAAEEDELRKRLGPFVDLEVETLKARQMTKTFSKERVISEEGADILAALSDDAYVVVLDERGKGVSSEDFARVLQERKDAGQKVVFVIGGTFGLDQAVRERADRVLALSEMTFTHEMVRVILLEQIYRGMCIMLGRSYHY